LPAFLRKLRISGPHTLAILSTKGPPHSLEMLSIEDTRAAVEEEIVVLPSELWQYPSLKKLEVLLKFDAMLVFSQPSESSRLEDVTFWGKCRMRLDESFDAWLPTQNRLSRLCLESTEGHYPNARPLHLESLSLQTLCLRIGTRYPLQALECPNLFHYTGPRSPKTKGLEAPDLRLLSLANDWFQLQREEAVSDLSTVVVSSRMLSLTVTNFGCLVSLNSLSNMPFLKSLVLHRVTQGFCDLRCLVGVAPALEHLEIWEDGYECHDLFGLALLLPRLVTFIFDVPGATLALNEVDALLECEAFPLLETMSCSAMLEDLAKHHIVPKAPRFKLHNTAVACPESEEEDDSETDPASFG